MELLSQPREVKCAHPEGAKQSVLGVVGDCSCGHCAKIRSNVRTCAQLSCAFCHSLESPFIKKLRTIEAKSKLKDANLCCFCIKLVFIDNWKSWLLFSSDIRDKTWWTANVPWCEKAPSCHISSMETQKQAQTFVMDFNQTWAASEFLIRSRSNSQLPRLGLTIMRAQSSV